MSFGLYAVGYLILIAGVALSGSPDAYSAALHCRDCVDHAGHRRGYRCAEHAAEGPELKAAGRSRLSGIIV